MSKRMKTTIGLGRLFVKESCPKSKAPARIAGSCDRKRKWKTFEAACVLDTSQKNENSISIECLVRAAILKQRQNFKEFPTKPPIGCVIKKHPFMTHQF